MQDPAPIYRPLQQPGHHGKDANAFVNRQDAGPVIQVGIEEEGRGQHGDREVEPGHEEPGDDDEGEPGKGYEPKADGGSSGAQRDGRHHGCCEQRRPAILGARHPEQPAGGGHDIGQVTAITLH